MTGICEMGFFLADKWEISRIFNDAGIESTHFANASNEQWIASVA